MVLTAEQAHTIEIWAPRYSSGHVLIAVRKVREHNRIVFTKAKHLPGAYYLSGDTIRKYDIESNGKISCYAVHMDELVALEEE